jgi:hypothetical protein
MSPIAGKQGRFRTPNFLRICAFGILCLFPGLKGIIRVHTFFIGIGVQKLYTRVSAAKEAGAVFRSEGHPWPIPRSSLALVTPNSPRFFVG